MDGPKTTGGYHPDPDTLPSLTLTGLNDSWTYSLAIISGGNYDNTNQWNIGGTALLRVVEELERGCGNLAGTGLPGGPSLGGSTFARDVLSRVRSRAHDSQVCHKKLAVMVEAAALIDARGLLGMRDDGQRYELVDGVLRTMSPAEGRHGRVAHSLALILGTHVRAQQLGLVYAAETGFLLAREPDTVRAPDVTFDPSTRTLHACRGSDRMIVLREGERLDAGDVVPGLTIAVAELFQG